MTVIKNIKCSNCGVFNKNKEYCINCNELISYQVKQELKKEAIKNIEVEKEKYKIENPNFVQRLKKHPFFLYKIVGWALYSVFFVISAIGTLIAWFIAMVAAG